jgi:hypothetical protein
MQFSLNRDCNIISYNDSILSIRNINNINFGGPVIACLTVDSRGLKRSRVQSRSGGGGG